LALLFAEAARGRSAVSFDPIEANSLTASIFFSSRHTGTPETEITIPCHTPSQRTTGWIYVLRTWHRFSHNASTLAFLEVNRCLNEYLPDTCASPTCKPLVSRNKKESYLHWMHPAYDLLPRGFSSFLSSIEFSPPPFNKRGNGKLITDKCFLGLSRI
jgi:hypothetical protein